MIPILASLSASGASLKVVHRGDSVESIAAGVGNPGLVQQIRRLNELEPGEQPGVGDVLHMPHLDGEEILEGELLSLWGHGELIPPGGTPAPLVTGLALPPGSVVCTDANSYATVRLATAAGQHDDITLLGSTCITLESVVMRHASRSSVVSLDRGGLTIRASGDPGEVTVITDSGLTTGDGGSFRVALEDTAVRSEALFAGVTVMGGGAAVAVDAGFGSRTSAGEIPTPPSRLLAPEALLSPPDGAELRRPDFAWQPVDRALSYVVEVSVTEDFSQIVRAIEVPLSEWSPDFLFTPYRVEGLWWRVAPVDRAGFVGLPSDPGALAFPSGTGL